MSIIEKTAYPYYVKPVELNLSKEQIGKIKGKLSQFPCIKEIIDSPQAGYWERTLLLNLLNYKGFTQKEMEDILKSFISKSKWARSACTRTHAKHLSAYNYPMPSCKLIMEKYSLCPHSKDQSKCPFYNKILE